MSYKRQVKKLINIFRINKVLKDKIKIMEEESEFKGILLIDLEEENTKLKNTVVSSMDLVQSYKTGMLQMRSHLSQLMASQYAEKDLFGENEEEEELDEYKSLRKKTTIH